MIRDLYRTLSEAAKPKPKSKPKSKDKPKAKPIPREEPILTVKLVDGKKTRDTIAVDFIGGGHNFVYPEIIPKGEVWIEQDLAPDEQTDILVHELIEFALMKQGMTYTPAHNLANKLEKVFRNFEGRWKTKQAPGADKVEEEESAPAAAPQPAPATPPAAPAAKLPPPKIVPFKLSDGTEGEARLQRPGMRFVYIKAGPEDKHADEDGMHNVGVVYLSSQTWHYRGSGAYGYRHEGYAKDRINAIAGAVRAYRRGLDDEKKAEEERKKQREEEERKQAEAKAARGEPLPQHKNPQVDSPEFKAWFKGSKAADKKGQPKRMYRGTRSDMDKSFRGSLSFTDDPDIASVYSNDPEANWMERGLDGRVTPVFLSLKNPVMLDKKTMVSMEDLKKIMPSMTDDDVKAISKELSGYAHMHKTANRGGVHYVDVYAIVDTKAFTNIAKRLGYDGVIHKDVFTAGKEASQRLIDKPGDHLRLGRGDTHLTYRVFSMNQVKSATGNKGTFDPKSDNIGEAEIVLKRPTTMRAFETPEARIERLKAKGFYKGGTTEAAVEIAPEAWIDKEGNYYPVPMEGHVEAAPIISGKTEAQLEKMGWCKISDRAIYADDKFHFTDAQRAVIQVWREVWGHGVSAPAMYGHLYDDWTGKDSHLTEAEGLVNEAKVPLTNSVPITMPKVWFHGDQSFPKYHTNNGVTRFAYYAGAKPDEIKKPVPDVVEKLYRAGELKNIHHVYPDSEWRIGRTYSGRSNFGFGIYLTGEVDWARRYGDFITVAYIDPALILAGNWSDRDTPGTVMHAVMEKVKSLSGDRMNMGAQARVFYRAIKAVDRTKKALYVQTGAGGGQLAVYDKSIIHSNSVMEFMGKSEIKEAETPKGVCPKCGLQKHSAIPHLCPNGRSKWGMKGGKFTTPERKRYRIKEATTIDPKAVYRIGDLPKQMREELFNLHATHVNPDATERDFYAKRVPTGVINLEGVKVDNVSTRELDKNVPPIVIADSRLIDGQHRIASARKAGVTKLRYIDLTGLISTEGSGYISDLPSDVLQESVKESLLAIVKDTASNKHPDDHVPEDYTWAREKAFNTEKLCHLMPGGIAGWKTWFTGEVKSDPEKYGTLAKADKINDPVIVSPGHIWDGWHRIAAAIVNGIKTIPAIVGTHAR
jgi:hypothetical protein